MVIYMISDIILIVIIMAITASVIFYIVKEKKKGVKCIGCPSAQACAQKDKTSQSSSVSSENSNGCSCKNSEN